MDHHPDTGVQAPFVDIRSKYGATASIMTEYLRAAKIKPSTKLATGLFYGIKTDTDNFVRQTLIEDIRAFQFLYRHANLHLVNKIERSELRLGFLKYFEIAIANQRVRKKQYVCPSRCGGKSGCLCPRRRFFYESQYGGLEHRFGDI